MSPDNKGKTYLKVIMLLVFLFPTWSGAQTKWVILYYMEYSNISGSDGYPQNFTTVPGQIPFYGITHIIHKASSSTEATTSRSPYWSPMVNAADSIAYVWMDGFNVTDSVIKYGHAAGAKVLTELGATGNMDAVLNDSAKTQIMVNAVVDFAKRHGYDGVDIDWEATVTEATYSRMIRLMRRRMTTTWGGYRPRGLIVVTGNMYAENISVAIQDSIDALQIMSYDYIYNNDNVTAFNAPLYPPPASLSQSLYNWQDNWWGAWMAEGFNVPKHGFRYLVNAGWNTSKIIYGIPLYGHLFSGNTAPGQSVGGGFWAPFCSYEMADSATRSGGGYHWVDTSKVPWTGGTATRQLTTDYQSGVGLGEHFFITYDDTNSVKWKVRFAKQFNLGGVMLYDSWYGYVRKPQNGSHQPLIRSIVQEIHSSS